MKIHRCESISRRNIEGKLSPRKGNSFPADTQLWNTQSGKLSLFPADLFILFCFFFYFVGKCTYTVAASVFVIFPGIGTQLHRASTWTEEWWLTKDPPFSRWTRIAPSLVDWWAIIFSISPMCSQPSSYYWVHIISNKTPSYYTSFSQLCCSKFLNNLPTM